MAYKVPELRLDRILSNRGVGNGVVIRSGAIKFNSSIDILVNGELCKEQPLLLVYNKPEGVQSTNKDPWGRDSLENCMADRLDLKLYHHVGRLDADTSGLLLFSKNGDLTNALLNPSNKIPREYVVIVKGAVNHDELKQKLKNGVKTSLGILCLNLLESKVLTDTSQYLSKLEELRRPKNVANNDSDHESISNDDTNLSQVCVVCYEGKHRMVRRVLHNAGHSVVSLHRTKFGNIDIGTLPKGELRPCSQEETDWASQYCARK